MATMVSLYIDNAIRLALLPENIGPVGTGLFITHDDFIAVHWIFTAIKPVHHNSRFKDITDC